MFTQRSGAVLTLVPGVIADSAHFSEPTPVPVCKVNFFRLKGQCQDVRDPFFHDSNLNHTLKYFCICFRFREDICKKFHGVIDTRFRIYGAIAGIIP